MNPKFTEEVRQNTNKLCNAPSCCRPRAGINIWCKHCLITARLYGHPQATPLRSFQWKVEHREVTSLFASNGNHPGFLQVIKFLEGWMVKAAESESAYRGAEEIARILRAGITAKDVLVEVVAFWLFTSRPEAKAALPTTKALDVALSRAVFALSPRPRRVTSGNSKKPGEWWKLPHTKPSIYSPKPRVASVGYIGKFLRETLSVFIANAEHAIGQQRLVKADPDALLKAPFTIKRVKQVREGLPFP
jgi:hypothetical protein